MSGLNYFSDKLIIIIIRALLKSIHRFKDYRRLFKRWQLTNLQNIVSPAVFIVFFAAAQNRLRN